MAPLDHDNSNGARLSRRRMLQVTGAASLTSLWGLDLAAAYAAAGTQGTFVHGVASGDPLSDSVVIWTRVTPDRTLGPVDVGWAVARDPRFKRVVAKGSVETGPWRDWTVKVDVQGLAPGRTYYYRFRTRGDRSPVGRTRTAPSGSPEALSFAVLTCGDWNRGLFHAYGRVAERDDIDAVIHLGDYIYEHGRQDRVRPVTPAHECRTLADYRLRYASYRTDAHLAEMHRRHPFIWVWDDHETVDGAWMHGGDPSNHDPAEDGDYEARKVAARQAAFEWLPIRAPDPSDPERIYRRLAFGDLVDLFMIDTRLIGRDRQLEGNIDGDFFHQTGDFADPRRQLLGARQEEWLTSGLRASESAWRLVGNQVIFSPLRLIGAPEASGQSVYVNPDQWDGYAPARDRVLDALAASRVEDLVILTGDVHASLAFEVARDPSNPLAYNPVTGAGAQAVELITPSISSAGDPQQPDDPEELIEQLVIKGQQGLRISNPHLKYIKAELNGYLMLKVDRERVRSEFWLVPHVTRPTDEQSLDRAFVTPRGESRLLDA